MEFVRVLFIIICLSYRNKFEEMCLPVSMCSGIDNSLFWCEIETKCVILGSTVRYVALTKSPTVSHIKGKASKNITIVTGSLLQAKTICKFSDLKFNNEVIVCKGETAEKRKPILSSNKNKTSDHVGFLMKRRVMVLSRVS